MPLPLAVGSSVHVGLAELLRLSSAPSHDTPLAIEGLAVAVALADFAQYRSTLELPTTEADEITKSTMPTEGERRFEDTFEDLAQQGFTPDQIEALTRKQDDGRAKFAEYLYREQSALVEGMVRAYARRRLIPLLQQYEVLEIEREGEWVLSEWWEAATTPDVVEQQLMSEPHRLLFMSRPDALLLDRESRQLVLLSFKTTSTWDVRRQRDAEHDLQGLTEGVEVERRLATWWEEIKAMPAPWVVGSGAYVSTVHQIGDEVISAPMADYLRHLDSPPRILAVRYELLMKGDRRIDKDLTQRFGFECRSQSSPLVRAYQNSGMVKGDEQWNVSWSYLKPDSPGESSKLYWKTWRSTPVFEHMTPLEWITMMDESHMLTVVDEIMGPQERGYISAAQHTGYLKSDPLADVFLPPIVIFRNDDELRDMIEQIEFQERGVAEGVEQVNLASGEGERRSLLNRYFPQSLHSCEWPATCSFTRICFGGEEIRRNPLGSGLYQIRVPNHAMEKV